MSLGIAFKGSEGIVLAADSRVTLTVALPNNVLLPATYDNATKLLQVSNQPFVGAVTYGAGALGTTEPRTAHSFMPEFEDNLPDGNQERMSVQTFAERLSRFFNEQWSELMPEAYEGPDMIFLIGGYDEDEPYGRVYEVRIPSDPNPTEQNTGSFGIIWGGQRELTDRILQGFAPTLPTMIQEHLDLTDDETSKLVDYLRGQLNLRIPYQFLPLQDCVDLSIALIRTTIRFQGWAVDVRGVGGFIDVATITATNGFRIVQEKQISGEHI